jgi:hypothetical protein
MTGLYAKLRPEPCNEPGCTRLIEGPNWRGQRCGGILFGTTADPGIGCGKFFCGTHSVGRLGPFYCRPCWEAGKASGKIATRQPRL